MIVPAVAFLIGVIASALSGFLPLLIPVFYLALSLVAWVTYAIDKSAARNGRWRTSEETLHLLALAGGWPGALVAQKTLRHKSGKASFRRVFRVTVVINCAALAWLHTAGARRGVDRLIAWEQALVSQCEHAVCTAIATRSNAGNRGG